MRFSSLFIRKKPQQLDTGGLQTDLPVDIGGNSSPPPSPESPAMSTFAHPCPLVSTEIDFPFDQWCLPTQAAWATDFSPLKIIEKGRQVGITRVDALHSVIIVSHKDARHDVFVSSRDEDSAGFYVDDCADWARILDIAVKDRGMVMLDRRNHISARVLEFANGRKIYSLSSNPNALAGKRGHVKLDEFALHPDQRLLYHVAKPVTQWGGTLSIISTHRGVGTLFNQFIQDIRHRGNPMGWKLYSYPIQKAVEEGIVARINEKTGRSETNEEWLARTRAQCSDEEQWL